MYDETVAVSHPEKNFRVPVPVLVESWAWSEKQLNGRFDLDKAIAKSLLINHDSIVHDRIAISIQIGRIRQSDLESVCAL